MNELLAKFFRHYMRLTPWERSGRIYEWLGIAKLDRFLAGMFGATVVPRYKPGLTASRNFLSDQYHRGRYSEVVNIICFVIYLVIMAFSVVHHLTWAFWYAVLLSLTHLQVIPVERYKRALISEWMNHPDQLTDEEIPIRPRRSPEQLKHWFYSPRPFESEKFYDKLVVDSYRRFVSWLTYMSQAESRDNAPPVNALKKRSLEYLDDFEAGTRQSEAIHWIGILEHIPFYVAFVNVQAWAALVWMIWPFYLNLWAIFLQRQHRARIMRLLLKRADSSGSLNPA